MKTLLIATTSALTLAAAPAMAQEIPSDKPQHGPEAVEFLNKRELSEIKTDADATPKKVRAMTKADTDKPEMERAKKYKTDKAHDMKQAEAKPTFGPIVVVAAAEPDFSTFATLVKKAGLEDELKGPGPMTIFAPTNDAFAALDKDTLMDLKSDEVRLEKVLKAHIVPEKVMMSDITDRKTEYETMGDTMLILERDTAGKLSASNVAVSRGDIVAENGVIHVLDQVIIPETDRDSVLADNFGS
ncbi:MAG: hypothetical protein CMK09_08180 [Ponticaulis sp.]|nr:hypothetical protein [Ponticaulis sp.]|tara:strand:- start:23752 stop:24480 length:729 start_codon:yes stop_codon:yes gene_type:complete